MGPIERFQLSSGERLVGEREASTAQQALFDYLRSLGCQDDEIMKLSPDAVSWRGAVYHAVPMRSERGQTEQPA